MLLPIMHGANHFRCGFADHLRRVSAGAQARYGIQLRPPEDIAEEAEPLKAHVNWNRWIVECPDCHSAEFAWIDEPVFLCSNCLNGVVGGRWRRVAWPAKRRQIEAVLKARPVPNVRNWSPHETVATLVAENRAYGIGG